MFGLPDGYITGLGRDVPQPRLAHIYKGTLADPGWPMCRYGWNREEGTAYSIWRNNIGRGGICKLCYNRMLAGRDSVPPKGYDPNAPADDDEWGMCPDGECPACDFVRRVQHGDATWNDLDKMKADGVELLCNASSPRKE